MDIDSELYEVKRQLQDAVTSAEAEVKLVQLKVDQIGRENDELRGQKRELDSALRKLQSDNVQAAHQVSLSKWMIIDTDYLFEAEHIKCKILFKTVFTDHLR